MRIIKVNAIDSTNSFVRKFYEPGAGTEPVCVQAHHQTRGRGQRGSAWLSKPGENLTFSVLYPHEKLNFSRNFLLSATVSLVVVETLFDFKIPNLKVKWPNDILSAKKKIGGILIENIINNSRIAASIIGIGLNVNQKDFKDLPAAGSLFSLTGKKYDLDELLNILLLKIDEKLKDLPLADETELLEKYAENMFRLNQVSAFELPSGDRINGIIRGVTTEGKLNLEIEDAVFRTFDLKEIQLLY
ncbi:biotin--[acetyl-CoA-carboxylase] ligase [Christiangramia fulva]|uniref:Biotin--[acetyl-CoA-carboxylase] ligase n=1 Tax=Christiangramia fulva TaxID=2126553 RepID=A0A2R3Z1A1_9FLAO|nr:biotin--[acetyl-CoA-carboxylase] ligase [Christiangramia fulva]AVR44028.1 biotin--[acetyl-CoA-carboxylase] ligase [Christiangramia fulva]